MIENDLTLQNWYYDENGYLTDEFLTYFRDDLIIKHYGPSIFGIEVPRFEEIETPVINNIDQYGPVLAYLNREPGYEDFVKKLSKGSDALFMTFDCVVSDDGIKEITGYTTDDLGDTPKCLSYWYKVVDTYNSEDYDYEGYPQGYPVTRYYLSLKRPVPKLGADVTDPYNIEGWTKVGEYLVDFDERTIFYSQLIDEDHDA